MKILFINPGLRPNSSCKLLPVGLASVMTFVKQRGYEFDFLDLDINPCSDDKLESIFSSQSFDVVLVGAIVTHYPWIKWLTTIIKKVSSNTLIVIGNTVASAIPKLLLQYSRADIVVLGEGECTTIEVLQAHEQNKYFGFL